MGDEKDSGFDSDFKKENLAKNLVTLCRSRPAFIGKLTKLMKNCLWMITLKQLNV